MCIFYNSYDLALSDTFGRPTAQSVFTLRSHTQYCLTQEPQIHYTSEFLYLQIVAIQFSPTHGLLCTGCVVFSWVTQESTGKSNRDCDREC